jgi:transposase-like protein
MSGSIAEGPRPAASLREESKREAIRLAGRPGIGSGQMAKSLGINRTMLRTWRSQHQPT